LGAFNHNFSKIVVSMRVVHVAANSESSSFNLPLAGAAFVILFPPFSGWSGPLADEAGKRRVPIGVEVFVKGLGLEAFFSTRIEWMLLVLLSMALPMAPPRHSNPRLGGWLQVRQPRSGLANLHPGPW
jgi:hypothetical protein